MMIVAATRADLRDEMSMADEAFALSPISARATMPGEADYDAIREAFMETSRGRWFLSEYARRNRNADTHMVLEAVARIEENLAAQRNAAPDVALPEVLAAIRDALDEAKADASAVFGGVEESLAPIRNGAQGIRKVLSKLREIGADGRIYDLIDSEVSAIEESCGQIASIGGKAALSTAFDRIEQRIREVEGNDDAQSSAGDAAPPPSAIVDETRAAAVQTSPSSEPAPETAAASRHEDVAAAAQIETAIAEVDVAHDDAVLDLIALEMAAPDFGQPDIAETDVMQANPVEANIIAQISEPPAPQPVPAPLASLGASLIAQGIVRRPDASAADPLAPIRRMSQAEKIAFFS
jgi:hypothetical protein